MIWTRQKKALLALAGAASLGLFFKDQFKGAVKVNSTERDIRSRIVQLVQNEQAAPNVDKYWAEILPGSTPTSHPPNWCGALILWAYHVAGLTQIPWKIGTGYIYPLKLPQTKSPQIGDTAYFEKFQHHALVAEVLGNNQFALLNGNSTRSTQFLEGAITRSVKRLDEVTAFFSIQPLIDALKKAT